MPGELAFDFGRGDPLPGCPIDFDVENVDNRHRRENIFQSLARANDDDLLDYIDRRRVSQGFLFEIDMFLAAHPELEVYAPKFVNDFNSRPPLEAYRFFMKGYTKPARYVSGWIPDVRFVLPADGLRSFRPLVDEFDPELLDFFNGYDYRYDILKRIDDEVYDIMKVLVNGQYDVSRNRRLLVAYHLWGNPVDAYKWYEYNYQEEWLAHRYLPEHVVLADIPKAFDHVKASAHVIPGPNECHSSAVRSHPNIRARMAHASDQGVDVIDVLMDEFTRELMRCYLARREIEDLQRQATEALEEERANPTQKDIVDLVMSFAAGKHKQRPRYDRCLTFVVEHTVPKLVPEYKDTLPGEMRLNFDVEQVVLDNGASVPVSKRERKKANRARRRARQAAAAMLNPQNSKAAKKQGRRIEQLHALRTKLAKAYDGQAAARAVNSPQLHAAIQERRRLEREYIKLLVAYSACGGQLGLGYGTPEIQQLYSLHYYTEAKQAEAERLNLARPNLFDLFGAATSKKQNAAA